MMDPRGKVVRGLQAGDADLPGASWPRREAAALVEFIKSLRSANVAERPVEGSRSMSPVQTHDAEPRPRDADGATT